MAALGLKAVEVLAEKHGVELDLGEVKKVDEYLSAASANESGPQPVELASRLVAHVMHRIPGSRKIAKKFEGADKKSGVFSDLAVLIYSIVLRNEDALFEAGEKTVTEFFSKEKGTTVEDKDGNTILDLGKVSPSVVHNNHKTED